MRRLPPSGSKTPLSQRRSRKGDSGRDIGPIKPGEHSTGARHRRRDALAAADGDAALRTKQPSGAECRLPALPADVGAHCEPAQHRASVRDAEDPRQPGRLLGERLAALEHGRALAAPRQLVGGREPAYPGADDDNHLVKRRLPLTRYSPQGLGSNCVTPAKEPGRLRYDAHVPISGVPATSTPAPGKPALLLGAFDIASVG